MNQPSEAKPVRESRVTMSQRMLPEDANPSGNVHGGAVLKLIDSAAAVAAMRHCRERVVTARLDEMNFLRPVSIGNLLTIRASVNHVGNTSMEVGVRAEAEDLATGETWHVASAYLIFVALDAAGKPAPVPGLIAETEAERRRMEAAKRRRSLRRRHAHALEPLGLKRG
jgi:uncharacterized protein (TIGR00369 family)